MSAQGDPRVAFAILAGLACVFGLIIMFVLPLVGRFSIAIEALSLLITGIGEYFGNTRLIWLGCLVFLLITAACCIIVVAAGGALLTCNTAHPSQLCRLIGR